MRKLNSSNFLWGAYRRPKKEKNGDLKKWIWDRRSEEMKSGLEKTIPRRSRSQTQHLMANLGVQLRLMIKENTYGGIGLPALKIAPLKKKQKAA